jgi:hypothetical protein
VPGPPHPRGGEHRVGEGGGVGAALGEVLPVELGVERLGPGGVDLGDLDLETGQGRLGPGHGLVQPGLRLVVGAFEPVQSGDLGVETGLLDHPRIARRQRLDLVERQRGVPDVVDLADVEAAAHDLVDERGFAGDGLVEVAVEAAFGDVAVDLHLGVRVALAQDAPVALVL